LVIAVVAGVYLIGRRRHRHRAEHDEASPRAELDRAAVQARLGAKGLRTGRAQALPNANHRALARLAAAAGAPIVTTDYELHIETAAAFELSGVIRARALPSARGRGGWS
jgi:hypothetical protein